MLRTHNLTKYYDDHVVFQGLTRTFSSGCIALCEEENTGKSTLLRIIAGLITPDEGDVWIDGYSMAESPGQAKSRLAYVPDNCLMSPTQTGRGFLEQAASEKNVAVDDAVLILAEQLGLEPHLDKRFEQMSTGTRRKVYLTAAALGDPAVVIADGPSDGLDAQAWDVLVDLFSSWARDRVVLFASHDADLVQACNATMLELGPLR